MNEVTTQQTQLTDLAFSKLVRLLENYGNKLHEPQRITLHTLLKTFTEMAYGVRHGRYAFGLPTGTGKTSAIIAWISAIEELKIENLSVAVTCSQVEALCRLHDCLTQAGVSPEQIGLLHEKPFHAEKAKINSDYARLPKTENNSHRPYLLSTQQKIRCGHLDEFHFYKRKSRSLVCWDESLFVSEVWTLPLNNFAGTSYVLDGMVKEYPELREMQRYFQAGLSFLNEEAQAVKKEPQTVPTKSLRLPLISSEQINEWKSLVQQREYKTFLPQYTAQCLDFINQPLRVLPLAKGNLVRYEVSIPDALTNMVILDASFPIRELIRVDPRIKDAQEYIPEIKHKGIKFEDLKRFDRVEIRQWFKGGGRESLQADLQRERLAIKETVKVAVNIPQNEAILFFLFKPKQQSLKNYQHVLMKSLANEGIDLHGTVDVKYGQGKVEHKPRLNFLCWGQETSLNEYSYCSNVILVGVLHRSELDIASTYIAQSDDLSTSVDSKQAYHFMQSECGHCIYQAASRGSCRISENGQARPMKIWLIHRFKGIKEILEKVFKGAKWLEWLTGQQQHKDYSPRQGQVTIIAKIIKEYLTTLGEGVEKISTQEIRRHVVIPIKDFSNRSWTRAIVESVRSSEWKLMGRSLVRKNAQFKAFGFDQKIA